MLPEALLPDLLELEADLPADPTTFFAAAFDPSAPPAPGARAAAEVLRHAASQGLETADLMQQLRMLGLGEAGAIFFANYWAAQPSRASLQREPPLQLLDVDWSFGVSASSSEHQAMGTTFVQLRLSTQGQNGGEFVHTGAAVARPPLPRATRDSLSLSLFLTLTLSLFSLSRSLSLSTSLRECSALAFVLTRVHVSLPRRALAQSSTSRASTTSSISSSSRRRGWRSRDEEAEMTRLEAAACRFGERESVCR
jgi:COMM domain